MEEHEDAFKDANLYAGKVVNMPSRPLHEWSIKQMQKEYQIIFDAFIAGVDWARRQK